MVRQPAETQTLFAELSERLRALEAGRSFASLAGAFTKKRVRGGDYWYFKTSEGAAGQREYFIGPDNHESRAVMKAYAGGRADAEATRAQIERLCAMLRQGGAMLIDAPSARVIAGLASAGVFRAGAVLVGTQAFIALGNLLGVRWESALRTQDIDLAADRVLRVAVPQIDADLPRALEALKMGFLPVPGLNPGDPDTSFTVRGRTLRVDLLTPARGARNGKPVPIPRLKAAAQPLEFLDFLLEAPVHVPLVDGGATLVNVPDPARFALHKLIVSGRRHPFEQVKSGKDRQQAGEILSALYEDRRGDLRLAVDALNVRPASWRTRLRRELAKLPEALAPARAILQHGLRETLVGFLLGAAVLGGICPAWAGVPALVWVSTYNSAGVTDDQTRAIAADANGNAYAAGFERRNDLGQGYNANLQKRDATGLVVWTTTYHTTGANHEYGYGVALDPSGNVILCGSEDRTADLNQSENAFVRKYDGNGLLKWVTTYDAGGSQPERAYAVATDTAGNVLVTGSETKSGEAENIWVKKYDPNGLVLWSVGYNSPANNTDIGYGIAADAAGAVYVAGASNRPDIAQDYDSWIRKYDANGAVQWTVNYGGAPGVADSAYAVAVDKAGGVYVTGATGAGAAQDLWLRKLNASDGLTTWTTTYNGAANLADVGRGLAVDASGNVYVTGSENTAAGQDILLRKYDTNGLLVWTTTWNSSYQQDDDGYGIAVDAVGNVYAAGRTFTSPVGEGWNGWTAKYSQTVVPDGLVDTGQVEVPVTISMPGVGAVSVLVPRNDIRVFVESRPDAPPGVVRSGAGQVVVTAVGNIRAGSFSFRVFNRLGELVDEQAADKGTRSSWTWQPGNLDAGVYLIQVDGPDVRAIKKVAVGR